MRLHLLFFIFVAIAALFPSLTANSILHASDDTMYVPLVGEYWGYYGSYGRGYGVDVDGDECGSGRKREVIISYTGSLPEYADCSTIDESSATVNLDFKACTGLPDEAQIGTTNCHTAAGYSVLDLQLTFTPYEDGGSDGYGELYLMIEMPSGDFLEASGPFSHCADGNPCY